MGRIADFEWKRSAGRYFQIMTIGAVLALAHLVANIMTMDRLSYYLSGLLSLLLIWTAIKRPVDEFARDCWNMGARWAFFLVVASLTMLPFFAGVYDGAMGLATYASKPTTDYMLTLLPAACVIVFFAGFHWCRLHGGAR